MKQIIKRAMEATPYRIARDHGANRFEAAETCLRLLRRRGFEATTVIDGGANVGSFSLMAKNVFPTAKFHLIEPQPSCERHLRSLCAANDWKLHACAISDTAGSARMRVSQDFDTGAYLTDDASGTGIVTDTLDRMFAETLRNERTLLKLDLQGHELHALRGAITVLPHIDVIIAEVAFFSQVSPPSVADLIGFLAAHQYHLHDVAALHGRMRDNRLHGGDFVFARNGSAIAQDVGWS